MLEVELRSPARDKIGRSASRRSKFRRLRGSTAHQYAVKKMSQLNLFDSPFHPGQLTGKVCLCSAARTLRLAQVGEGGRRGETSTAAYGVSMTSNLARRDDGVCALDNELDRVSGAKGSRRLARFKHTERAIATLTGLSQGSLKKACAEPASARDDKK